MEKYEKRVERLSKYLTKRKDEKIEELKNDPNNKKKLIELGEIDEHIKFLELMDKQRNDLLKKLKEESK